MASTEGLQAFEEEKLPLSLPKERGWASRYLYLYQDFWCPSTHIQGVNDFQKHFEAKDSDVIVASFPKSGTTWLKALTFSILNRNVSPLQRIIHYSLPTLMSLCLSLTSSFMLITFKTNFLTCLI